MTSVFRDKSIFSVSTLIFAKNGKNIFECCKNKTEPYLNKYGQLVYDISNSEQIKLECYLRRDLTFAVKTVERLDMEESIIYYAGWMHNLESIPNNLHIFTIGIGDINGVKSKIQLMPVEQSPLQKITNQVLGVRIRVRVIENMIMRETT